MCREERHPRTGKVTGDRLQTLLLPFFQLLDLGVLPLLFFPSHSSWGGKHEDVLHFAFSRLSPFVSTSDLPLVFNAPLSAFRNERGEGREALQQPKWPLHISCLQMDTIWFL